MTILKHDSYSKVSGGLYQIVKTDGKMTMQMLSIWPLTTVLCRKYTYPTKFKRAESKAA